APQAPVCERLIVQDATTEALAALLADNPRGVALVQDELAGWMAGMNQYRAGGGGNDRQFFLSAWSPSPVTVDRRKDHDLGPLRVERPFLSVLGGLTPANLGLLQRDTARRGPVDDGFIDRVLFAWPLPLPASEETWRTVPAPAAAAWDMAYRNLRQLPTPVTHQGVTPQQLELTRAARRVYHEFTQQHAGEMNTAGFPEHLRGTWLKLKGYWGRLGLIVQLLRWACGGADGNEVDDESARRAGQLVAYFKGMALRVSAHL